MRKNVGYLPVVSAAAVADPEMNAMPALAISGPTASTSWLPAGPTTATIFEFEVNCWVTVVACAGLSWVSPWTIEIFVLLARLSFSDRELREVQLLLPEHGHRAGERALHADRGDTGLGGAAGGGTASLLLLLLPQPATASAPTAAAATITLDFMGTPSLAIQSAVDQTIALHTRAREGF